MTDHERDPFIPEAEVKRHHPGWLTPEGLVGDEMRAKLGELVAADYRLDETSRPNVIAGLGTILAAAAPNAPVILLHNPVDGRPEVGAVGYLGSDFGLGRDGDDIAGNWALNARVFREGYNGEWDDAKVRYSLWAAVNDLAHGAPRLLVGEQAVGEWLQWRGLATTRVRDPEVFHVVNDLNLLEKMRKARMSINHLGLSDPDRDLMASYCTAYLVGGRDYVVPEVESLYDVFEYILGAKTVEQRHDIYGSLVDEIVPEIPTSHQDPDDLRLLGLAFKLGERFNPIKTKLQGMSPDVKVRDKTYAAYTLTTMFQRRAQLPDDPDDTLIPVEPASLAPGPWPEDHKPHAFTAHSMSTDRAREDLAYVHHLIGSDRPVEDLQLSGHRGTRLSMGLHRFMMDHAEPNEIPLVLRAIEYIHNLDTEEKRRHFYAKEFLYKLAMELPLNEYHSESLTRFIVVAEAVAPKLPESLFSYRETSFTGRAAVAALIADLYEWRGDRLLQIDLAKAGQNDEGNETGLDDDIDDEDLEGQDET